MTSENLQIQAYQAIRNQIIYSELPPGSKISEKNLEDYLKIGRTPIREALIKLRQENLVYTIPQSGTYISQIDLEKASNARFVREMLFISGWIVLQMLVESISCLKTQLRQFLLMAIPFKKMKFLHMIIDLPLIHPIVLLNFMGIIRNWPYP